MSVIICIIVSFLSAYISASVMLYVIWKRFGKLALEVSKENSKEEAVEIWEVWNEL